MNSQLAKQKVESVKNHLAFDCDLTRTSDVANKLDSIQALT